jgi:hypothetical protein
LGKVESSAEIALQAPIVGTLLSAITLWPAVQDVNKAQVPALSF